MSFKERYRYDPDDLAAAEPENLASRERFWRDYQPWLLERGYRLRARYQPDWVASWTSFKEETFAEDSLRIRVRDPSQPDDLPAYRTYQYSKLMDAVRISDGALVVLKRSDPIEDPDEVDIAQFLTTGLRSADPRNHCVPIYETFPVPDLNDAVIIVMPLLYDLESPRFDTVGEAIECFRQIFEGVQFIHENNVAHGDCKYDSFMVDSKALFRGLSDQPHPWFPTRRRDYQGPPRTATTRTRSPVKYFIIDYNLSRRYEGPGPHLESPGWGGDKTVPEWRSRELCDPFPVDVYCLGNTIREVFTQGWDLDPGKKGFDFMKSLVNDMCAEDPKARPNMAEVVARFEKIRLGLSERKLRSRIASLDENPIAGVFRFAFHWSRQIIPIWRRIPATPHC